MRAPMAHTHPMSTSRSAADIVTEFYASLITGKEAVRLLMADCEYQSEEQAWKRLGNYWWKQHLKFPDRELAVDDMRF